LVLFLQNKPETGEVTNESRSAYVILRLSPLDKYMTRIKIRMRIWMIYSTGFVTNKALKGKMISEKKKYGDNVIEL
jgi:hypothetical protein